MSNTTPNTPNPTSPETPGHAPLPIHREPEALVENIYPVPGTEDLADLPSQDLMGEYLIDRFAPDAGPSVRIGLTPSGHTLPGLTREPSGFKEVSRWRKTDPREWYISPRKAAAIMIGSFVLFNSFGNHKTIAGSIQYVAHTIDQWIDPVPDVVHKKRTETRTLGPFEEISIDASTNNKVGDSSADPNAIQSFVDQVAEARAEGAVLINVKITANASDERSNEESIGRPDKDNVDLASRRAISALAAIEDKGLNLENIVEVLFKENILTPEEKADVLGKAQANGFDSVRDAIRAIDRGDTVSPDLKERIDQLFTGPSKRGVTLTATIQRPGEEKVDVKITKTSTPGVDIPPIVKDPEFFGFIPMLPVRRHKRNSEVKQTHKWKFTPRLDIYKPELIVEDEDQAWVRLRPEAIREDGTLVDNAWAYTRKYEHLLRDNRIVDMIRADFKNASGEEKALRVFFVDHAPAAETVELFEKLLAKFAAMEDGKIGDRVSGIFVYPSDNAGTAHGDEKRIAMGVDKQSPEHILGTYTYPLDLVELHMLTDTWDPEELEEMFNSFMGTAWVASHEVGGHGMDENDKTLRARKIRTRNIPNAHVIDQDPRARKMKRLENVLRNIPKRRQRNDDPIMFDISYPVLDNNGQTVTMTARVDENDPRFAHATQATIVGYKPTQYAGSNESEHFAETAASVITGIPVPFSQVGIKTRRLRTDSGETAQFAEGYRPDALGQRLYTKSVGAVEGLYPIEFDEMPEVKISHIHPHNDPLIRREKFRTSRLSTLRPEQMKAILARVSRSNKSK